MLAQPCDSSLDDEFGKPVESIMQCEDFKSNFARKLSKRYVSRFPASGSSQDSVLKLCPAKKQDVLNKVPERIEPRSQLSKSDNQMKKALKIVKPPNKVVSNADIRDTEVNALNMEVETLRWQLAQTEANRQMHIALLKQIVTFLNRVKDHIESQNCESEIGLDKILPTALSTSLNKSDSPRSRSVLNVSKNLDDSISSTKKISTRKMSKSINTVNGFKEGPSTWRKSKLSYIIEEGTGHMLTEEISRFTTLANTVLSTKIPDLACARVHNRSETSLLLTENGVKEERKALNVRESMKLDFKTTKDNIVLISNCKRDNDISSFDDMKNRFLNDFIVSHSPHTFGLEKESPDVKVFEEDPLVSQNGLDRSCGSVDKKNEYNVLSNSIEDESGFSSMSSFQEIGIPIISIIPPSPCKEVEYLEENAAVNEKWKIDSNGLHKQSVFWV